MNVFCRSAKCVAQRIGFIIRGNSHKYNEFDLFPNLLDVRLDLNS